MVKMPHLNLKFFLAIFSVALELLNCLVDLFGSLAQMEENDVAIHSLVERLCRGRAEQELQYETKTQTRPCLKHAR